MSAAHPSATAQGYIDAFVARTGWKPRHAASFARGAALHALQTPSSAC
jgi:hypothetical protein